jgi:hypothetical protein
VSTRTDLEDAIRLWLVAAGAAGGIPSADAAVIIADQDQARPPLPYVSLKVIVYDVPEKVDEDWVNTATPPQWQARGLRSGTVSLNAFGPTADGWLDRAHLMLGAPSIRDLLGDAGIELVPRGGINNLSGKLDASTQARFQRDYAIGYRRVAADTETETVTDLATVHYDIEAESTTPSTRTVSIIEVL